MENYKFSVGDKVRYLNWKNPFTIVRVHPDGLYTIRGLSPEGYEAVGTVPIKSLTAIEPEYNYIPDQECEKDDI